MRTAFRASSVTVLSRALEVPEADVAALAYRPRPDGPPAVMVLDVTDRSARDAGGILGLADPHRGVGPGGAEVAVTTEGSWRLPPWPSERIRPDAPPPPEPLVGPDWRVEADGGFVRLVLPDGATWRAGVGTPLWTDGSAVLAWDGERLLLYDFVPR